MLMDNFGSRLKHYRKKMKNLTLDEFSAITGIPRSTIFEIEKGKHLPAGSKIRALIQNTDVNIYWLFTGDAPEVRISSESKEAWMRAWGDPVLRGIIEVLNGDHYAKMVVAEVIDLKGSYERLLSRLKEYVEDKMKGKLEIAEEKDILK